jgi:hypothetical protein
VEVWHPWKGQFPEGSQVSERWAEQETWVGRPHKLQEVTRCGRRVVMSNNCEEVTDGGLTATV